MVKYITREHIGEMHHAQCMPGAGAETYSTEILMRMQYLWDKLQKIERQQFRQVWLELCAFANRQQYRIWQIFASRCNIRGTRDVAMPGYSRTIRRQKF